MNKSDINENKSLASSFTLESLDTIHNLRTIQLRLLNRTFEVLVILFMKENSLGRIFMKRITNNTVLLRIYRKLSNLSISVVSNYSMHKGMVLNKKQNYIIKSFK